MYTRFCLARQDNNPISGPTLKEEALAVAKELRYCNFKASNGWLDSFKSCNNLK